MRSHRQETANLPITFEEMRRIGVRFSVSTVLEMLASAREAAHEATPRDPLALSELLEHLEKAELCAMRMLCDEAPSSLI